MRSLRDLIDYQEGNRRFPNCQVGKGTEMESVDSMDCQEGSRKIPYCQVGRDEKVSLNQPEQLTEEEDRENILMIGRIGIFLSLNPGEAKFCVADDAAEET